MHRVISGLKWARGLEARPSVIPVGRPRGAKRHGVKYERDFAKALGPVAWHGKWFEFMDVNGHGWCQPDFVLRVGDSLIVLEAKYTWVPEGHSQIDQLYKPVLEGAFGLRVSGIVVCKNLTKEAPMATDSLADAVQQALLGRRVVLHWIAGPVSRETSGARIVPGQSPGAPSAKPPLAVPSFDL